MISSILSRLVILLFGTLYPAYASYKAVKTKNLKEYVKWMMYWIVFALFTCTETFTDVFLSWFPFYYEIKIILVLWLLSPATRGSSILYRKFVHPMLSSKEQEIDEYLLKAKEQSYKQVLDLGSKGVNVLMQTALKGGGGIVNQLRKSYSLSDLTGPSGSQIRDEQSETDGLSELKSSRKKRAIAASTSSNIYFAEVDVRQDITHIKSTDDISSGYSSGEVLYGQVAKLQSSREGLVRSGSMVSTRSKSVRMTRSTVVPKKSSALTDSDEREYESQEDDDSDSRLSDKVLPIENITKNEDETSKVVSTLTKNEIACLMPPQNVENKIGSLYKSKSVGSLNVAMIAPANNTKKINERAGKYKKRAAPLPPKITGTENSSRDSTNQTVSTIRATLVLKPGHLTSSERDKSKSLPLKSKKHPLTRFKEGSPFSRFLTMSKKLTFWNRDEQDENDLKMVSDLKRSSWFADTPRSTHLMLTDSKPLSRSAENFQFSDSNRSTRSEHFRNLELDVD